MSDLTKEIQKGKYQGQKVWICHYNQPNLNKKPLRNIKPTECLVCNNSELPKNKTIYYSECHFRALNKRGEPAGRPISPVDNTGYRSYEGSPLETFTTRHECEQRWNEMLSEVEKRLNEKIKDIEANTMKQRDKITEMMIF